MKPLIVVLLIFSGLSLAAQEVEELWSGTASVKVSTSTEVMEGQRIERVLHRLKQDDIFGVSEVSIGELMFTAFLAGRLQAFTDLSLKKKLGEEIFLGMMDTVDVVDPVTFKISKERIIVCHNPADYTKVNLHLRLSYHADGSIQQKIIAASLDYALEGSKKPPLYFKVNQLQKAISFDDLNGNTVDRISFQVPFNSLKTRSNSKLSLSGVMKHLTKLILATDGKDFSSTSDWSSDVGNDVFTVSGAQLCSLVVVDPITYEIPEQIYVDNSMYTKVNRIRLYQYWAWDERAACLIISPIGYAPINTERDEKGTTLYNYPAINWAHPWYRKN